MSTQSQSFSIGDRVIYRHMAEGNPIGGVIVRMADAITEIYVVRFDDGREVDGFAGFELEKAS